MMRDICLLCRIKKENCKKKVENQGEAEKLHARRVIPG